MPSFATFASKLTVLITILQLLSTPVAHARPISQPQVSNKPNLGRRIPGGIELPITRKAPPRNRRRGLKEKRGTLTGEIGLGNNADLLYTVPIEIGGIAAAVNIDTGSSDLWLITSGCRTGTCRNSTVTRYPDSAVKRTGADVQMFYGDSTTGTHAKGVVATDVASIAGIAMEDQKFGAINDTNNVIVQFGTSGIFGLGFPSGSKVQEAVTVMKSGPVEKTDAFIKSTRSDGPLLSRISMTDALEKPLFSVTLQRNTVDIGGEGLLTVGSLPEGVSDDEITWVPVRLYPVDEGGLEAPTFAPQELYPFRWEIDIEGVFLDGQRIPDSKIPATGGVNSRRVSALIDTGNSLIRGPDDVVDNILRRVSPTFNPNSPTAPVVSCNTPRTLAFQIGGKRFPVDPRDFISPIDDKDQVNCVADNLVSTDAPGVGHTFSWSLGDPFMRSNLVVFHYGNLETPSLDPPRIGFKSLVPTNANALLQQAILDAKQTGGFEQKLDVAPTQSALLDDDITVFPGLGQPTSVPKVTTTVALAGPTGGVNANAGTENSAVSLALGPTESLGRSIKLLTAVGLTLGSVLGFVV